MPPIAPAQAPAIVTLSSIQADARRVDLSTVLLATDFETDPMLSGWTVTGGTANWTATEAFSGTHSLFALGATWSSPAIQTGPLQWYRLSFKSKAPGTVHNPGSIGYAFWSALFYDNTGNLLSADQYSSVFQSNAWVDNEYRIRAKTTASADSALVATRMKVNFQPIAEQPLYVDDVVVEMTTDAEVLQWADTLYARIPQLTYVPKANRWERIPLALEKLRSAQTLRIVMLGDSVQQDTANAPIDAFIERQYPGSTVELIASTRGGTGVQYYKDHVHEFITAYRPDLLVIGGISNEEDIADFQSVIDQVRAFDTASGHTTEIMLLTRAWSPNIYPMPRYFLAPGSIELDQTPINNLTIPDDYRGFLLGLAFINNIEFLDIEGVVSEFIYGPAAVAGYGPPDEFGNPYSFWMRDAIHSNDYGKQILGRVLEAYVAPLATIGNFSPPTAPVGTAITIRGDYFSGVSAVYFNGIRAPDFTIDSANRLRATVPGGVAGGYITVRTPAGISTSSRRFRIAR